MLDQSSQKAPVWSNMHSGITLATCLTCNIVGSVCCSITNATALLSILLSWSVNVWLNSQTAPMWSNMHSDIAVGNVLYVTLLEISVNSISDQGYCFALYFIDLKCKCWTWQSKSSNVIQHALRHCPCNMPYMLHCWECPLIAGWISGSALLSIWYFVDLKWKCLTEQSNGSDVIQHHPWNMSYM